MHGTFEVVKDPTVAFEIMAPVYWDHVRQHATTFNADRPMIGRAKFTSCVNDTKIDVVVDVTDAKISPIETKQDCRASFDVALDRAKRSFDSLVQQMKELKLERDQLKSQLLATQEKNKPVDNGDGTVTQLLPVTYCDKWKGRAMACGQPKFGQVYVSNSGQVSTNSVSKFDRDDFRLILSPPEPAKPEPVTWSAPLTDGEWIARPNDAYSRENGVFTYYFAYKAIRGFSAPLKPGRYLFRDGVGTLISGDV